MKVIEVPLDQISVKDRFRGELGNIDELVDSIRAKGVLQPITIDTESKLLAGERRLTAARKAGLATIPCVVRATQDNIDALEIELFENIHRKDFLWAERARLEKRIFDLKSEKDPNWSQRRQA